MVESERECIDIITQISAARSALDAITQIVVKDYAMSCVNEFSPEDGTDKMKDLMKLIFKYL